MRIAILSNNSKLYSSTRLKNAARSRGHTVRVLNPAKFSLDIHRDNPEVTYQGKRLAKFDAVIPRIATSSTMVGTAVVRQLEQMGVFCLNPSFAISVSRDKLRSMQILSRHHIEAPRTAIVFDKGDIKPALERIGGAPAVIKVFEGTHGAGVLLAETPQMASAIVEALQVAGHNVLIQEFIAESQGQDIRAFVVGDRVVAAMKRTAVEGEFRSNVHLGAAVEAVELDPDYEAAAITAARIMGLRVAGVDLMESSEGPHILEVNSSPGLEGIERATQIDVADAIISYLEEQVMFPDVDLRERISLSKGYSIADIPVLSNSSFVNKTIGEALFAENEIRVLTIKRDSITFPLPRASEVLYAGDVLLCFGKQAALKALMPEKLLKKGKTNKLKKIEAAEAAQAQQAISDPQ